MRLQREKTAESFDRAGMAWSNVDPSVPEALAGWKR